MIVVENINLKHVKSPKSANEADCMKELSFETETFKYIIVHLNSEVQVPVQYKNNSKLRSRSQFSTRSFFNVSIS